MKANEPRTDEDNGLLVSGDSADDGTDLAVIVVSANSREWMDRCLSSVSEHAGDLSVDLVVVDAESTDGTREFVERRFPQAQVLTVENRGFAAGNNAGLAATRAPFVLLLNPDTAIVEGSLAPWSTGSCSGQRWASSERVS